MSTGTKINRTSKTQRHSIQALRLALVAAFAFAIALVFAAPSAEATPGAEDDITTIVPGDHVPTELQKDAPTLGPQDWGIELAVKAEIKADCSFDPAVAHVTFINNSDSLKTFGLSIFGSVDGTTENVDIGPGITHVRTVNGVDDAYLSVRYDGSVLASKTVNCGLSSQLVPVEPFPIEPVIPEPGATTTPLLPSIGTQASVVDVICGGTAEPNQIVVQLTNETNGDRTFEIFRSNGNTIEPRSATLTSDETRLETFDAVAGQHLVQVYVGIVAVAEQDVDVDCVSAEPPLVEIPSVPENVTPTPLLPVPEGTDTPQAPETPEVPETPAVPGSIAGDEGTAKGISDNPDQNPADLASAAPVAVVDSVVAAPVTAATNAASLMLLLTGIVLLMTVGVLGIALARTSANARRD